MSSPTPGVSLAWLLDGIAALPSADAGGTATAGRGAAGHDARVEDLTLDSREIRPGSLFLALAGRRAHGLTFAAEAAARGARVVLWEPATDGFGIAEPAEVPVSTDSLFVAQVPGLRALVGRIADRFFGWPSSHLRITGITGTNGKTTCAYLLAQALGQLKSDAAYIGTIGWGRIGALHPPTLTTPDVVSVHRQLARLRSMGVRDVAMEVSSHALDQGRIDGVRLHTAVFTNLTRDHLDYHGSMQAYGEVKARLFASADLAHAVVNIGDDFGRELARRHVGRVPLTAVWVGGPGVGWLAEKTVHAADVALDVDGLSMTVDGSYGSCSVQTQLVGRFNVENAVIVLGCLVSFGLPLRDAAAALAGCTAPPGRMEIVRTVTRSKALAVIDYAHTPDALAKALAALREHCRGALWCVFGCGGDRDPGKRPLMGRLAEELADQVIVTDDNPRSEDPELITDGIVAGFAVRQPQVIHDRGHAIAAALDAALPGDIVLIAGKGHEDYQIYGDVRRDFSDRHEVLRHLGAAA